jgi:hypothetical protein
MTRKEYKKQYDLTNKNEIAEQKRLYYLENKDRILERQRGDREEDREKFITRGKRWREKNKDTVNSRDRSKYRSNLENTLLKGAKKRANKHGIAFNIELSDIIIPEFCPVLGFKLEVGNGKANDNSPSLDKIIPEKGYVKGNIRVISLRANKLKNDGSLEEFKKIVNYIDRETN